MRMGLRLWRVAMLANTSVLEVRELTTSELRPCVQYGERNYIKPISRILSNNAERFVVFGDGIDL